jgi:hypothetical protein
VSASRSVATGVDALISSAAVRAEGSTAAAVTPPHHLRVLPTDTARTFRRTNREPALAVRDLPGWALGYAFARCRGGYGTGREPRGASVERGSDKISARLDDERKHETEGLVRAGHTTHAEEWKDPEPAGEDQPEPDLAPGGTLHGGTPDGMDADDVEGRSEIASFLGKDCYPMVREQVINLAIDRNAPTRVVDLVRGLPSGREFANVNEIWTALGGHVEAHRS